MDDKSLLTRSQLAAAGAAAVFRRSGNAAEDCVLSRVEVASGYMSRFVGLMGRPAIPRDWGLLLIPCSSVHTFFMRFPIDVVCLDERFRIVDIRHSMPPYRIMLPRRRTSFILEAAGGVILKAALAEGDQLEFREIGAP